MACGTIDRAPVDFGPAVGKRRRLGASGLHHQARALRRPVSLAPWIALLALAWTRVEAGTLPLPYNTCDGRAFHALGVSQIDASDWYSVELTTGNFTLINQDLGAADDIRMNAMGYN